MTRLAVAATVAALAVPTPAAATTFRVENDRDIAQFSYWRVNGEEFWHPTDGFGVAEIEVVPGDVVRFTRSLSGPPRFPPPEGYDGRAFTVPSPAPAEMTVTLPSTGPIYRPALSDAERWVIGKANERRREKGVEPLRVSTTLSAAADSMARQSVLEDRWPPSYLTAYQQDFGWPSAGGAVLDNPGSSPRKAIAHWTDGSIRERALVDRRYDAIGVGEGGGWFIAQLSECPPGPAESRCGMTTDTGDPGIALPPDFTRENVFPPGSSAGSGTAAPDGRFTVKGTLECPPGDGCRVKTVISKDGVTIGGARYGLRAGTERRLASRLNARGRQLLARQGKLTARVVVTVARGREELKKRLRVSLTPRPRARPRP